MAKPKRKAQGKTFHSEVPSPVWPPTLTEQPAAFVERLSRVWGRGMSILGGTVLLGMGFFVLGGALGTGLGVLGIVMLASALAWNRLHGS